MNDVVKPGTVIKYTSYTDDIYYYALDDIVDSENKVWSKCVSSKGDLLKECGCFYVDYRLDNSYENIDEKLLKDFSPKEGELYLFKDEGKWKVLKYTKYSIGYCFDSLTDSHRYNFTGYTPVYPLVGITESMLTKHNYDELAKEYHSLQEKYDNLSNEYHSLSSDYDWLEESNNGLVADYTMLKEQKADLEKKVDYYYHQCKQFKDEIDSIKNKTAPDCKYWDGEHCNVKAVDTKPYEEEIERLKNLVIKLTEELMERR